jgi:putative ABC transport system substrate-binding protein
MGREFMNRRNLLGLLGGVLVARSVVISAETGPVPLIGMLFPGTTEGPFGFDATKTFFEGLGDQGYEEGRNVRVEYRHADGHFERLPELAQDLAR